MGKAEMEALDVREVGRVLLNWSGWRLIRR